MQVLIDNVMETAQFLAIFIRKGRNILKDDLDVHLIDTPWSVISFS